jgi:hypothetical protein
MTPQRKLAAYRLDDDLREGLQTVYERDGILPSEQVRRAVRTWLEAKGVLEQKSGRERVSTRKRR